MDLGLAATRGLVRPAARCDRQFAVESGGREDRPPSRCRRRPLR